MILDKLENADWYYDSVPGLKEFMKFYNDNDLEEMPACKIYLDGKDLFVNILDFKGKEEAKCRMEAHKDYLDIQIPLGDDEVMGWKIQNPEIERQVNPLGMIPIVEYNRAIDRTGCFERHISYMDGLNVLISDFANSVAQDTQQIWWGDNVDFDVDEKTGEAIKPESGDWLLTHSPENRKASVQALASGVDGSSTLNAIAFEWNRILQKCHVPIQQESAGGGSTGTATSMASGWQAAEVDALREESVVKRGMKEELRLILKAIELVPNSILEVNAPLRKIHAQDVDFHFNRNKNYDLSIKANTLATLINAGIHGRHAIKISEITADTESVWLDSEPIITKKQKKMFEEQQTATSTQSNTSEEKEAAGESSEDRRIMQDSSDQQGNSPFIGGKTGT